MSYLYRGRKDILELTGYQNFRIQSVLAWGSFPKLLYKDAKITSKKQQHKKYRNKDYG